MPHPEHRHGTVFPLTGPDLMGEAACAATALIPKDLERSVFDRREPLPV